ncbi:hypothetical protein Aduo_001491 [Ancylostoma duodenale]
MAEHMHFHPRQHRLLPASSSNAGSWKVAECRDVSSRDYGGEINNHLMDELKSLMGIERVYTKGYNPREKKTERFNETIIGMLRKKADVPAE